MSNAKEESESGRKLPKISKVFAVRNFDFRCIFQMFTFLPRFGKLGESTEFDAMLGLIWLHMKRKGLAAMIVTLCDDDDGDVNERKGE